MDIQVTEHMRRLNLMLSELDAVYHEATVKLGLTDSAMTVLYTLCMFDGFCPLGQIVSLSGLSKQTINSALRGLEAQGAVYLEPDGGRRKRVCLTEDGRALAGRTALRLIEMENQVLSAWPEEDRQTYLGLLRRFLTDLRERICEL